MRRIAIAALLLFALALPAAAAVETTTVRGKVLSPNGQIVTKGTITAVLSTAGSAEDPALGITQRVATRVIGTIDPNGDITGLVLVPNDVITPSNTHYTVSFSVQAPIYGSWAELWSVTTSPDPVDVGDITRLDVGGTLPIGGLVIEEGDAAKVSNATNIDFDAVGFTITQVGSEANVAIDPNVQLDAPTVKSRLIIGDGGVGDWVSFTDQNTVPACVGTVRGIWWDGTQNQHMVCDEGVLTAVGGGGPSFGTVNAPSGTDPVAEVGGDTLNLTCTGATCTGNATTDTLTIVSPGSERTLTVSPIAGQAKYTQWCGADCDDPNTPYTCQPGTAMYDAVALSPTKTNRVRIEGMPGSYANECLTTAGLSYVTLASAVPRTAIIRPTVTSYASVQRGALQLVNTSEGIELDGVFMQNDAWPGFTKCGAAVCIMDSGSETTTCSGSDCIQDLAITNSVLIGNEAAIRGFGGYGFDGIFAPKILNNILVGGWWGITLWDYVHPEIANNLIIQNHSYCIDASVSYPNHGNTITRGARCDGTGGCLNENPGATGFNVTTSGAAENFYRGSVVEVNDKGNGGVTCPIDPNDNRRIIERDIIDAGGASDHRFSLNKRFNATVTEECNVVIHGWAKTRFTASEGGLGFPPCQDKDWALYRPPVQGMAGGYGIWMNGPTADVADLQYNYGSDIWGNRIFQEFNSWTPEDGAGCGHRVQLAGIAHTGIMGKNRWLDNEVEYVVNTDLAKMVKTHSQPSGDCVSGSTCCDIDQVACYILAGNLDNAVIPAAGW